MTGLYVSEHAVQARNCRIGGITFWFGRKSGVCAVTTVYEGPTHRPQRKVPRSEESRKERHRQTRRLVKQAGR